MVAVSLKKKILEIKENKIENIDLRLVDYDINIVKQKIIDSGILEYEKVLMNLSFLAISGDGMIRYQFFHEAKDLMIQRGGKLFKENAKGIFTYFKLYDDDIWISLAEKYKKYFVF